MHTKIPAQEQRVVSFPLTLGRVQVVQILSPDRVHEAPGLVLAAAALIFLCLAQFLYGINQAELFRTESLRAVVAREMMARGNVLIPYLYGEPFLTKPPGMYLAIAIASWPFGTVSEWSARLPSAIAGSALVFLLFWYGRRQLGTAAGLLLAASVPCTILFLDKGSTAEIDMLQTFFVGASLVFFLRAVEPGENASAAGRWGWIWWFLALLCVSGSILTKWTGAVFFYATVIPFLLWRGQIRLLFRWPHLAAAGVGAALCLGWAAYVIASIGWQTAHASVLQEALPRLSHAHNLSQEQAKETALYPLAVLAASAPWSFYALFTFWPGFMSCWDARGRRLLQALHCWAWPNLLVWTILPDHDVRHSFPLGPGLTALGAMTWIAYLQRRTPARLARIHTACTVVGFALTGLCVFSTSFLASWRLPVADWWWIGLVGAAVLACTGTGLRGWRQRRPADMFVAIILCWVAFKVGFVHILQPIRAKNRMPEGKALPLLAALPEGETLLVNHVKEEGIFFYANRPVRRIRDWRQLPLDGLPRYGLAYEPEWRQLQADPLLEAEFIRQLPSEHRPAMYLFTIRRIPKKPAQPVFATRAAREAHEFSSGPDRF